MQFLVPQFIDVESKIIGPISVRQFIILLITAGIDFLLFRFFPLVPGFIMIFIITAIACAFAFGKVNTQPMHYFVLNLIQTVRRPRQRLWRRAQYVEYKLEKESEVQPYRTKPMVSQSRLAEMSLLVDTGGSYGMDTQRSAASVERIVNDEKSKSNNTLQHIQLKELNFDRVKDPRFYGEK
ncbi:MAG: PrgI family protein [Candidatus Kerfeldbacteria bacterium]|nr:PrgI family protein [Candidatus Kerfeldbacteria bacterium]